jgi:hypothetical protein
MACEFIDFAEIRVQKAGLGVILPQSRSRALEQFPVPIHPHQKPGLPNAVEDGPGMTPCTHRQVENP